MVQTTVLLACRRRCALCVGIDGVFDAQPGQLAHIDRNHENNDEGNAAWLCVNHHVEYDSSSPQTKRLTPDELRAYQAKLQELMKNPTFFEADSARHPKAASKSRHRLSHVTLELHQARLPIYRTATNFVRLVLNDLNPDLRDLFKYVAEIEMAVFLYDDDVAEYLAELFRRALRLRTIVVG
jgi:hypothetical protein